MHADSQISINFILITAKISQNNSFVQFNSFALSTSGITLIILLYIIRNVKDFLHKYKKYDNKISIFNF